MWSSENVVQWLHVELETDAYDDVIISKRICGRDITKFLENDFRKEYMEISDTSDREKLEFRAINLILFGDVKS